MRCLEIYAAFVLNIYDPIRKKNLHEQKKKRFVNKKKTHPTNLELVKKTNQPTKKIWSLFKKQIEPTKNIWSLSKKQIEPTKNIWSLSKKTNRTHQQIHCHYKLSVIIYIMHTFIRSSFGRQAYIVCKRTRANL